MKSLKQIKQRIKTAKNIQQITRAMKLVAAARLKKAQDRVLQARPYAEKMRELMGNLALAGDLPNHPLLNKRDTIRRVGYIVTSSDRGLAGSYNTNIIRKGFEAIKTHSSENVDLVSVGKKAHQFFERRGYNITAEYTLPNTGVTVEDAQAVTTAVREMFESGKVDAIYLVYAKFQSAMTQIPQVVQLLPIEPPNTEGLKRREYEFEPDAEELLAGLLPRYLFNQVFQSLLEATASEHGSRMTAMSSATDNAGKMIQDLTLTANRARQANITKEILEIVGGAEALKG